MLEWGERNGFSVARILAFHDDAKLTLLLDSLLLETVLSMLVSDCIVRDVTLMAAVRDIVAEDKRLYCSIYYIMSISRLLGVFLLFGSHLV